MNHVDELISEAERLSVAATDDPSLIPQYNAIMEQVARVEGPSGRRRTSMTQEDRIIQQMRKAGSITVREAMVDLHVQSLTRRIATLRERGYSIRSETKYHKVTGQKYVRYHLEDEPSRLRRAA